MPKGPKDTQPPSGGEVGSFSSTLSKMGMPRAANDNYRGWAVVRMPSDEMLRHPDFITGMAEYLCTVRFQGKLLSRRAVIEFLAWTIYQYDGDVFNHDGSRWDVESIDVDAPFTDPSFAWCGTFMKFGTTPPRQHMQKRTLPRLRLIFLGVAIHWIGEDRKRLKFLPQQEA